MRPCSTAETIGQVLTAPGVPVLNYAPDEVREPNELSQLDYATGRPETVNSE